MPDQHGPQRTGKFIVEFDDDKVAGWKTVTIPSVSIEQGSYREGNEAPEEKKVAGQPTYDDLEMERDVTVDDTTVWDWVNNIRHGKVDETRRDITVTSTDSEGNPLIRWQFTKSWPKNYDPPDLDASANGETGTEQLRISFDQMEEIPLKMICGKQVSPLIDTYNQSVDDLPSLVDQLLSGETIHLIVNGDESRDHAVETKSDNRIKSFQDQKPADPTVEVETECPTVTKIMNAEDPKAAATQAYENDDIAIRGTNPVKSAIIEAIEALYDLGRSIDLL